MTHAGSVTPGLKVAFALPGVIVLVLFFLLPLSAVVVEAVAGGGAAFTQLPRDPVFWRGLQNSLLLGTLAPLISVAIGTSVAMQVARQPESRRLAMLFVLSLPLTFSGLIVAYGFILVFGRAGFLTLLLAEIGADPAVLGGFIYSPVGLGVAYAYYLIPRVVLIVLPALLNFDNGQLAAARSLGAGPLQSLRDILLPQIFPSLLAAFCLTSAVAIGAYGTALALVGTQINILPLVLYSKISETGSDFPSAAALSVVLMAICSLVVALAEIFARSTLVSAPRRNPANA
jgi:putative spermidine/putrescine transport system permease protein